MQAIEQHVDARHRMTIHGKNDVGSPQAQDALGLGFHDTDTLPVTRLHDQRVIAIVPIKAASAVVLMDRQACRHRGHGEDAGEKQNREQSALHDSTSLVRWRIVDAGYTERVATTGGTFDARSAGASTDSCPSSHNTIAPTGRYHSGRRGNS